MTWLAGRIASPSPRFAWGYAKVGTHLLDELIAGYLAPLFSLVRTPVVAVARECREFVDLWTHVVWCDEVKFSNSPGEGLVQFCRI